MAMPILRKAKRVMLLERRGPHRAGPERQGRAGLPRGQRRHGDREDGRAAQRRGRARPSSPRPRRMGADLLIKGAYTQSRLRQMIFGGATSHILAAAELPVFFAH